MQNRDEVTEALRSIITILEAEGAAKPHLGEPTTDYVILMRACYGPLLPRNPTTGNYGLLPKRQRPDGSLQHARDLTAAVVELLGDERGATIPDVQAALDTLAAGA